MDLSAGDKPTHNLAAVAATARERYAARVAESNSALPWWTAVIITASSSRQAERYEWELRRRQEGGKIPAGVEYMAVRDSASHPIGSGAATLNALRALVSRALLNVQRIPRPLSLADWWSRQRVLLIHAGGDSRRLPQYSLSGKLFSVVPVATPWGEASTVFDEMLALSTGWIEHMPSGLVVGSGDVILTFDGGDVDWNRPGVTGVAMLQPVETGTRHGVYVTDERGRIYAFLQKPSVADLRNAGGLLENDQVALDTGLLRFSADAAAGLTRLAGVTEIDGRCELAANIAEEPATSGGAPAAMDLYHHVTMALTGQWKPGPQDARSLHALADALKGVPFSCCVVSGDFTHIGTTALLQELLTRETSFSCLHAVQRRFGMAPQRGVQSSGVVVDSVLSGGAELSSGTVAIECHLEGPVRGASGSVLHGLDGIPGNVDAPENSVMHQIPVVRPDGLRGTVIRVYGVDDDPKAPVAGSKATWFGRPLDEELKNLGLDPDRVWPGVPIQERALWNAQLFPLTTTEEAWNCARWLGGISNSYSVERWNESIRLSLATSAQWADSAALEAARSRRWQASWQTAALALVESGADIRPLLANSPGIGPLAKTGDALQARGERLKLSAPTEAASRYYAGSLFYAQAGLARESAESRTLAFQLVSRAVEAGGYAGLEAGPWQCEEVLAKAPARLDLGGGWTDTPPFCLDWGGTVLNVAALLNGEYPIQTRIRRLREPVVRCISGDEGRTEEYRTSADILAPTGPRDPFSIPRQALRMTGLFQAETPLASTLERLGGGLEIRTAVSLPLGSGLGTSSILAATTLRALSRMMGKHPDDQALVDRVMSLEQAIATGGGWQDQAGGVFPGAKLLISGPGMRQRVRVQPAAWNEEHQVEFERLVVLYYTGVRRLASDLLRQVVGRYLARETASLQVLHSIKTLATEMSYAMQQGEWDYLGSLIDRHWELNQVLDPNTTNAPINALLKAARPFVRGAKLAGAGGGGFLILLLRSPQARQELQAALARPELCNGGAVYDFQIARKGLQVTVRGVSEDAPA